MRIGAIVEISNYIRDHNKLTSLQDEAMCAACNILDRLPNMAEDSDIKAALDHICHNPR